MIKELVQKNIKDARKQAGLSQAKLADLLSISEQAIYYWESGRTSPAPEVVEKIAYVLKKDPLWFYTCAPGYDSDAPTDLEQRRDATLHNLLEAEPSFSRRDLNRPTPTEPMVSIPLKWFRKLLALYKGLMAVLPGAEPLPAEFDKLERQTALTQLERTFFVPAPVPAPEQVRDLVDPATLARLLELTAA